MDGALKRDYCPETMQSKGITFITKKDLKSLSSLVSSSMQPEEIIDDRDDSSCFHIHLDVCAFFDIQITGKGNCQNRRKGLINTKFWEEKKWRKRTRRKDVKPPDQL